LQTRLKIRDTIFRGLMVYPPLIGLLQGSKVAKHFVGNFRAMCRVAQPLFWMFGYGSKKGVNVCLSPKGAWIHHYSFELKIRVNTRSY